MTNIIASIIITLSTNITNVAMHEGCARCLEDPRHSVASPTEVGQPPGPPVRPWLPVIRRETTEIVRTFSTQFEWDGRAYLIPFHNETILRRVRRFKRTSGEEEIP